MTNEESIQCKSKGCSNPVLDGKYCEHCEQKRKEKRNRIWAGAGVFALPAVGVAIKKGALKQVPKIVAKVLQVILRG